ncbi:MAG: PAC2 family protein [Candidatus Thorarchaeota archaeon]
MHTRRFIDPDPGTLKDPVAVVGLPGIANVGRIAVETLVHELNAELVLQFFSDEFPPRVLVRDGISEIPKSSLYLYRAAPDEPHDLVILTGDYQPSTSKGVFEYADFVVQNFVTLGVRTVLALAAYEQDYQAFFESFPAAPRVYVSASSDGLLERMSGESGVIRMSQGAINGANGFIPGWAATMYDMDGGCFLGETMGMIKMDYRSAQRVLEVFSSVVGLKASFDSIAREAERVEDFIEWAKKELERRFEEGDESESPSDRYIG